MNDPIATPETPEHPKAVAAREQAARDRIRRNKEHADRLRLIADVESSGWKFLHVGDYTLCYRAVHRDVIQVGTAIRNPKDAPNKHIGKFTAAKNTYLERGHMQLRNPDRNVSTEQFLRRVFGEAQESGDSLNYTPTGLGAALGALSALITK